MRKVHSSAMLFVSICLLWISACGNGGQNTQDSSTQKKVEPISIFENEYVKVVKVTLRPGEELTAHEGEKRLIYSLSDYSIDWTEQGQNQGAKNWNRGDVHAHEAGKHAAINNGETTAEWLAFVRKKTELPECGDHSTENDVNLVAAKYATTLFDNEVFRVTEVKLPPSEKIPAHSGINRIIYSLSDYTIFYESDEEISKQKSFQKGEAHWHEACRHALENIGDSEARFLVVAYK